MSKSPPPNQPMTRRERRAVERAERSGERPAPKRAESQPAWRSPMVLITGGALVIGLLIIGYAILQRPAAPPPTTNDITRPASVIPPGLADGRTLGSADAPVTLEIWSDFQCPACQRLATEVEPDLIDDFVVPGTVRIVYRDAAFQGQYGDPSYDESVEAAAAARCAGEQGKFWEMHDWIFANWNGENEGAFSKERLRAIAGAAELDLAAYDACMATGEHQAAIRAETDAAIAGGINSTPTLVVNGAAIRGLPTYEQLVSVIEQAANQP